jgi:xanthine permease XanP
MMSGLQIILSSQPDTRRVFVIGTALCFGLSLDMLPDLYAHLTPWLRPLFESSLTLSTVIAVLLNQLLRVEEHFLAARKVAQPAPGLSSH